MSLATPTRQSWLSNLLSDWNSAHWSPAVFAYRVSRGRWVMAPHLNLLSQALGEVTRGEVKRLMVSMPPRHGKSLFVSQYFPAWYLGRDPHKRIILTSYEADFAAGWGRKSRDILAEHGPSIFGVRLKSDSKAANRWEVQGHDGGMMTAGVGGPITGKGADILIIDDPVKNADESRSPTMREKVWDWYKSTAFTRLEPGGAVVLIMTRWHQDDLAGRLLREGNEFDKEPWKVLKLPAICNSADDPLGRKIGDALWPQRYNVESLRPYMADPYWWSALYQQDPTAEGGSEWPPDYFDHAQFWFDDWPDNLAIRTMALDPSKGREDKAGDYSAYVLYGRASDGTEYVEADLRRRDAEQIVADGVEHLRKFGPEAFAVESNAFQHLFAPLFRSATAKLKVRLPLVLVNNFVKKIVRIRRLTEPLRVKKIRFRNTPGTKLLVQQLREFPLGEHDDGPDALEMARRIAVEMHNKKAMKRK